LEIGLAYTAVLLFMLPAIAKIKGTYYHAHQFIEMGSHWPQTTILISASQVVRITDVSH
jgi:hypothetical protein